MPYPHPQKPAGLSRRSFLRSTVAGAALTGSSPQQPGLASAEPPDASALLQINDLDRRIWKEELEDFVPARLYDMHAHLTRREFNLADRGEFWDDSRNLLPSAIFKQSGSIELLAACEALLYPGRSVTHLLAPNPHVKCDFDGSNAFIAGEASRQPGAAAQMVVHPSMSAAQVEKAVLQHRFVGFKPYRFYSITGDIEECRIADFMPEHQLAVADRHGLIIRMHLSRKEAIADRLNLDDLVRLSEKFPRVRWLLAHSARSYSAWALERAAPRLRQIPNLWYEGSSVCEVDAFHALFTLLDPDRICYGSDDFPVGVTRGKYVTYGYSWAQMDENNQTLNKSHCDGRMTFVRYEMLRAMRRAAVYAGLSRVQVERIFYDNGAALVEAVRRDLAQAPPTGGTWTVST